MKKLLTFFFVALLTTTASWAATSTVIASRVTSTHVTWTGSAGETWDVNVNGGATNQPITNGYAQIGTRASRTNSVTFTTSGISGTITSIVVDCASYNGLANVSASVGGIPFMDENENQNVGTPSWSGNPASGAEVELTGNSSGTIIVTMTNNSSAGRAMYIKSITVTYQPSSTPTPTCATPTFSPGEGTYTEAQSVTLSCETSGATIYYTTDGSTPTTNSTVYSGAIEVSSNMTIKAIAAASGYDNSEVAIATYTIAGGDSGSKIYRKVTSTDDLIPGQKYIIMYENGTSSVGMGALNSSNHFSGVQNLTVSNDKVNIAGTDVLELTLGGISGAWTLFTGDGYIQGNSSSGVTFNIVDNPTANSSKWDITDQANGNDGFVVRNVEYARYIRYYNGGSFRHYYETNGEWAYIYVQDDSNNPILSASPNPLNIYDTNEANGKSGNIYVSGEHLGNDNVGMTFDVSHSTNFSSNPGYFSHNGTVTDYPVQITYTGHALSATGIVYPANNVASTSVNLNYLYTGPIYVIGDVNNTAWNTNNGAQLTRDENGVYSATVSVQQSSDAGYISFTKQLGSNIGAYRFGPVTNGNWWFNDGFNNVYQPIDTLGNVNNIRIEPGTYTITVNPATNEFKIQHYAIDVTISPADGTTFSGSTISGTITDSPAGTIEWSTDGTNWQPYSDGFTATVDQVDGSVTIYARSTSNGVTSNPVSATYTRVLAPAPAAPVFSRPGGHVAPGTVVTITAQEGCTLYVNGELVTNPYEVTINSVTTITAYCVNDEGTPSETVSYQFELSNVCEEMIVFGDNGSDASATITTNSIRDYYLDGGDYIEDAVDILRVYKGTTGLKFGNSNNGGSITFNLDDDFVDWKTIHIILNAKQYNNSEVTFTVTTSAGESKTTSAMTSDFDNYSLDFDGSTITSITISSTARAYLKSFTIVNDCTQEGTLSEIERNFEPSTQRAVVVTDQLIGVWAAKNILWAKDKGNASIDATSIREGEQVDYVRMAKLKSKEEPFQIDEWDQSNWVMLDFSNTGESPLGYVGFEFENNSVVGYYVDDKNYRIELQQVPTKVGNIPMTNYPGFIGDPIDENNRYNLNHYVTSNFYEPNLNWGNYTGYLFEGEYNGEDISTSIFFMNPKICEIAQVWAVWNAGMHQFTIYENVGYSINGYDLDGAFNMNEETWKYNCRTTDSGLPEENLYGSVEDFLVDNAYYMFHVAIMRDNYNYGHRKSSQSLSKRNAEAVDAVAKDSNAVSGSIRVYPLDITTQGAQEPPTAVREIVDNAGKAVDSVRYFNVMGMESSVPFEGVNIVVTRYSDGTISTAKVLK